MTSVFVHFRNTSTLAAIVDQERLTTKADCIPGIRQVHTQHGHRVEQVVVQLRLHSTTVSRGVHAIGRMPM
jgi:hypothetical protein